MWTLLVVALTIPILVVANEAALHFQGIAIDGPFQFYDAMRRIQAGFKPGVDFQFFHGMGMPYLHYWMYALLGKSFAAAELTRQLFSAAAYTIVLLAFFRPFSRSWSETLCLTTVGLAVSWILKFSAVMFAAVGMLGVRSSLPTVLPAAVYALCGRSGRVPVIGALLGCALLISTEQGIAAFLAFVIVEGLLALRSRHRGERLKNLGATIGIAILVMVFLLICVGGPSGMIGVLRYNFSAVPKDQYWYFGSPPNPFLSTWSGVPDFLKILPLSVPMIAALILFLFYIRHALRLARENDRRGSSASSSELEAQRRATALATLTLYGLASCGSLLGALTLVYGEPLWRVLALVAILEVARWAAGRERQLDRGLLGVPRAFAGISLVVCAYAFLRVSLLTASLYTAFVHIPRDHISRHVGLTAAGIWPATLAEGQAIIDAHRGPNGQLPVLWSTYSGWIEARNGIFNPSFDYVIAALGHDNRQAYIEKFRATKPTLVQTMAPMYSGYEPWLENGNWQLYDDILDSYQVVGTTPWSLYWERRTTPAATPVLLTTIPIPHDTASIALPTVSQNLPVPESVLEVEIEYEIHNPLHALPLVGASPRYLIGVVGGYNDTPVSLAPYEHRARFLVFASPGQTPTLHFQTFSLLPGASWRPTLIRLYQRPLDAQNRPWAMGMLGRYAQTAK